MSIEWTNTTTREWEQGRTAMRAYLIANGRDTAEAWGAFRATMRRGDCSDAWACGAIDALLLRVTA